MKVFVSSTYVDLVEHRSAVADALERLGLQLNRMEAFGARPEDPTRACLSTIDSSELFVGIYAHRYGFIPEDSTVSITEAEFDHAFKNRRPTFCFMIDEKHRWPKQLIENEPGKSLLDKFKARLEGLVVRDFFTTADVLASRVASSIGRYLIVDPRRHDSRSVADFARPTLADVATMVFVDVMRLFCIAGSDSVGTGNRRRYPEFVDMANRHFEDFRAQVTRFASEYNVDTVSKSDKVEQGLGWAIDRLGREPKLDRTWIEFVREMRVVAESVNSLAESVSPDYYASRTREVSRTVDALSATKLSRSPDLFWQLRLSLQDGVFVETEGVVIATIRDDRDRKLAIPYFAIDLALLRKVTD